MRRAIGQRLVGKRAEKPEESTIIGPTTRSLQSTVIPTTVQSDAVQLQSTYQQEDHDPQPNQKHHETMLKLRDQIQRIALNPY